MPIGSTLIDYRRPSTAVAAAFAPSPSGVKAAALFPRRISAPP
jgi:hypothetical protein